MELTKQEENIKMYRDYGISEWREKCLVLSDVERINFLYDLENGIQSDLVAIVKLPFPQFVTIYCKRFPQADTYTARPDFGYKMYMLKANALKIYMELLRDPTAKRNELKRKCKCQYDTNDFYDIMNTPYSEIPKACDTATKLVVSELGLKYAYISQYIDTKEALNMGLPIYYHFEQEETLKGFDLEGKLKTLNPIARVIISRSLGLYGYDRTKMTDIAREFNISNSYIQKCLALLFPPLLKTLGDFISKTGYQDPNETDNSGLIEYSYKPYRDLDIALETQYVKNNLLTEAQQQILSSVNNFTFQVYIANKFFGWTDEQICKNLITTQNDLDRIKGSIDFHG